MLKRIIVLLVAFVSILAFILFTVYSFGYLLAISLLLAVAAYLLNDLWKISWKSY